MPEIRLRHVVSCSSQDATHCAENLLKADTYRKWRSAKAGEKQISVILQLEKEEQIHSIDIGNEGSAFVEVLAGSSAGGAGEHDYEVLLVTSSFMSPSESRSGTNSNRVRLFAADKLVRATAEKRWDRVKIVCSQPYSKDSAYGLSFIRLHSPPEKEAPEASPGPKVTKLGAFRVKEDEGTGSSLRPGSLFFSRAGKAPPAPPREQPGPSYAAATLQASEGVTPQTPPSSSPQPPSASKAPGKPQESPKGKRKLDLSQDEPGNRAQARPAQPKLPAPKKPKGPAAGPAQGPPQAEKKGPKAGVGPAELGRILEGVVVVLSGFQNPFRSELRDKALELGAKYRPDWTSDSTHLICAFANTPKYSAVLSRGGRIVRKEWVLDCHCMRRRLPCRRYLMAGPDSSSDEETPPPPATKHPKANHQAPPAGPKSGSRTPSPEEAGPAHREPQRAPDPEEESAGAQDHGTEDSGDTEDELRRVVKPRDQQQPPDPGENGEDPYAGSTDENTEDESPESPDQPIPELPDFFQGKHFFFYGEFPGEERRQLVRYVTAFNGEIEDYMNDQVQFVITAQEWDPSFEEALLDNPSLAFVRPRWIYSCNEQQRLLPYQLYGVVPQA
ncbi:DNA repair protein XRCC1 isoform X2 [Antechinus flavipes]|uniref:DNA repair protein XRCC1 isoform X2 n=1 Tax=Antechinus flavipes TaxID=38775 RepID=UPI0022364D53|nr:DNA repair protein XRCC1 isoform X2 [Antechinus flavipes]